MFILSVFWLFFYVLIIFKVSTRFWVSTSFWNWLVKRVFLIIFIMHSWLSRCSTARGSCSGLSLEGSTKVNAGKSFLFTEDSLKVENKEYLVNFVVTLYFISLCSNALSSWEWKVIFPISGQTSVLYPYWLVFIFLNKPRAYTGWTYCRTYFTPSMLQILDFGRSDRYFQS